MVLLLDGQYKHGSEDRRRKQRGRYLQVRSQDASSLPEGYRFPPLKGTGSDRGAPPFLHTLPHRLTLPFRCLDRDAWGSLLGKAAPLGTSEPTAYVPPCSVGHPASKQHGPSHKSTLSGAT